MPAPPIYRYRGPHEGMRLLELPEIDRPLVLTPGAVVEVRWADGTPLPAETLRVLERQAIFARLEALNGNLVETARSLGISRTTLWRRLRGYRMDEILKARPRRGA